jgi:TRAP-type C4-dicarboxylate transport system permease small subunit
VYKIFQEWIEKLEVLGAASILVVITLINGAEIFSRYVLGRSILWAQEITLFLAMWMVFLGAGVLYKRKGYIVVNFLTDLFGKQTRYILSLIVSVCSLVFLVFLFISSVQLALHQGRFVSTGLHVNLRYFVIPITIASISLFITTVDAMLDAIEEQKGISIR